MNNFLLSLLLIAAFLWPACQPQAEQSTTDPPAGGADLPPFSLDELQRRTFLYFWELADSTYGQIPDRYPSRTFSSIAATGFGLSSYLVGIERGYVSRAEAAERVRMTLDALWNRPQGPEETGVIGHKGFFYHFLTYEEATRFKDVELSTIDTGLLMAGVLSVMSYFDADDPVEADIRRLADQLYKRVEWDWFLMDDGLLSMGWRPDRGYIPARWQGYNEAMILLVLALGSPTHPIPAESWDHWTAGYAWETFQGQAHVNFAPLFGHQYSHIYLDFRGIQDAYMREQGIDYFENSRRATLANRAYCIQNPRQFVGYGENSWGLTACDGPGREKIAWQGDSVRFRTYWARGAAAGDIRDDGTLTPTAAGGSFPFTPKESEAALRHFWETHQNKLVDEYGFRDAFNLTYPGEWYDTDYLGIDQGPILIQIENHRSGLIWEVMKKNPYIIAGLEKAGFTGGWLEGEMRGEK